MGWECDSLLYPTYIGIFCFFDSHSVVVLTHGLVKKSQKTPQREIDKAKLFTQKRLFKKRSKMSDLKNIYQIEKKKKIRNFPWALTKATSSSRLG